MILTDLAITCTCKNCGATYLVEVITGGDPIDEDVTMLIGIAYSRGDTVRIENLGELRYSVCTCEMEGGLG